MYITTIADPYVQINYSLSLSLSELPVILEPLTFQLLENDSAGQPQTSDNSISHWRAFYLSYKQFTSRDVVYSLRFLPIKNYTDRDSISDQHIYQIVCCPLEYWTMLY